MQINRFSLDKKKKESDFINDTVTLAIGKQRIVALY